MEPCLSKQLFFELLNAFPTEGRIYSVQSVYGALD